MRVVIAEQYGDESVLRIVDRPEPEREAGHVLVSMRATTVGIPDTLIRKGVMAPLTPDLPMPFVLGWDIAGVVTQDGERFSAGDRVVGMLPWFELGGTRGTHQEIVSADERWLARIPDELDWAVAAALPLDATTAAQGLEMVGAQPGESLLILGASGPVGGFAAELAALDRVRVIAVASTDDEAHLAELGVERVLPRQDPADLVAAVRTFAPDGVDAVFDSASIGAGAIGAVRDGGRFITAFDPSAPPPERGITVDGVHSHPDAELLARIVGRVAAGELHPRIADRLPLDRVAEAHRRVEAGGLRGKIVLTF